MSKYKNAIVDGIINAELIDLVISYSLSEYLTTDSNFQAWSIVLFFSVISFASMALLYKKTSFLINIMNCLISMLCCAFVILLNFGVLLCGGRTLGHLIFKSRIIGNADGLISIMYLSIYVIIISIARAILLLIKTQK